MITKAFASDWEGGWRYTVNCYRGCVHGCTYCFARRYHEFLGYGAGTDFETKIVVKPNAPQVLREELKKTRQKMPHVDFSFATDPYLPLEASYELTRKCLDSVCRFRRACRCDHQVTARDARHRRAEKLNVIQSSSRFRF